MKFIRIQIQLKDKLDLMHEKKKKLIRYKRWQKIRDIYISIRIQARLINILIRIFNMKFPIKFLIFEQENINIKYKYNIHGRNPNLR